MTYGGGGGAGGTSTLTGAMIAPLGSTPGTITGDGQVMISF